MILPIRRFGSSFFLVRHATSLSRQYVNQQQKQWQIGNCHVAVVLWQSTMDVARRVCQSWQLFCGNLPWMKTVYKQHPA
jgi:hypothetical protein